MLTLRWLAEQIFDESDEEDVEDGRVKTEQIGAKDGEPASLPGPPVQQVLAAAGPQLSKDVGGSSRRRRLRDAMGQDLVDKRLLTDLVWPGVPSGGGRREAWQMLLGYRSLCKERRTATLRRKRQEYASLRREIYDASPAAATKRTSTSRESSWVFLCGNVEADAFRQIRKDLPRIVLCGASSQESPFHGIQVLVDDSRIQELMERVLLIWSIRHPGAGYVQGLSDVLLPLLLVFLADRAGVELCSLGVSCLDLLGSNDLESIEADCYWCLAKLLSEVADHYTEGQPGLQRAAVQLRSLVARSDEELALHLEEEGLNFNTIVLRWLGCLMVRDLPLPCCVRLWDTCIAESSSADRRSCFASFLLHFCAAFLLAHSDSLVDAPFDELMAFVQQPPSQDPKCRRTAAMTTIQSRKC
eukprot:TRINITY_DN18354_c0_g1_i2.p1 TRINITY_DN18354_c0_g1~~TRINITY_DN18354_c0_g1_i2.p1  ORF type:complete len:414 (-),score=75.11 TRINITY_DN18354_c0_g1_i2:379-1620(-)